MIFESFDNKKIKINEWKNVEHPKGIVQIIHGMVEHSKRYEAFANFLNKNGYIVVADDHRGHGETDPNTLGYCNCDMFNDTVTDEILITEHYKKQYPDLKYFIFGFSYGSFLTQKYIAKNGFNIDGAIIAGSNYKKDFEVYLGSFVCLFNKKTKPAKLIEKLSFGKYAKHFDDKEWLSNDPENNKKYHNDPLCSFTCSYRFYTDFFKGLRSLYTKKYINQLNKDLPILLISGENDPVGDMGKGVKKLYYFYKNKALIKDLTIKLVENSRHEFLNEKKSRDDSFKFILNYLNSKNY